LFFWDFLSQFVISDTHTNRDAHSFISVPVFDSPASPPLRQPKQSGEEKEQLPFIRTMRKICRASISEKEGETEAFFLETTKNHLLIWP
jgi:hypothetical protein